MDSPHSQQNGPNNSHADQFTVFASALQRFERRVLGLVLSSFIFAAVSTIVEQRHFDPDFMAFTTLVAGTTGTAGLLSEYVAGLRSALTEGSFLLRFEPSRSSRYIALLFLVSALFLGFFYVLALNSNPLSAGCVAISSFAFFKALTRSMLVMQASEAQYGLWRDMTVAERGDWIVAETRRELEKERLDVQMRRLAEQIAAGSQEIREMSDQVRENRPGSRGTGFRGDSPGRRLKALTLPIRQKVPGGRFLTLDERVATTQANEMLSQLTQKTHEQNISRFRSEQVVPSVVENTGLHFYEVGAWRYFELDPPTEAQAAHVVAVMRPLLSEGQSRHRSAVAVLKPDASLSHEAWTMLQQAGIEIFREVDGTAAPG